MKNKNRILVTAAVLLLWLPEVHSQDAHFSQFNASPLILNPAVTGMFDGEYRAHLHHRTQWASVISNPFTTQAVTFDMPYKQFGYGGFIQSSRAGAGNYKVLNFLLSGSYEVTLDPKKIHRLTTGLQMGFVHQSVNIEELTFDNQYSTLNGGGFDPSLSSGEAFEKTSFLKPDINYGIYYSHNDPALRFKPQAGMSLFHITRPKEAFFGQDTRLPTRWVFNGSVKVKIHETLDLEPAALYMKQLNNNQLNFGLFAHYFIKESNTRCYGGLFYRTKDATVIQAGMTWKEFIFRISYDVNVSALERYTRGRGAFEISITYTKQKGKYVPSIQ